MPCHATTPMGWHMAHGIACGYSTRLPHTRFRCESDLAHLLPQVVVCSDARDQPELRFQPVGGEFVEIRHRSIFGSREPGVPRDVVAMA